VILRHIFKVLFFSVYFFFTDLYFLSLNVEDASVIDVLKTSNLLPQSISYLFQYNFPKS